MMRLSKWRTKNIVRHAVVTLFLWFSVSVLVSSCFLSISSGSLSSWSSSYATEWRDIPGQLFTTLMSAFNFSGRPRDLMLSNAVAPELNPRSQDVHLIRTSETELEGSLLDSTKSATMLSDNGMRNSRPGDGGPVETDVDPESSRQFQRDGELAGTLTDAEVREYKGRWIDDLPLPTGQGQVHHSRICVEIAQFLGNWKCVEFLKLMTASIRDELVGFSSRFALNLHETLLPDIIASSQLPGNPYKVLGLSENDLTGEAFICISKCILHKKYMRGSIPKLLSPLELPSPLHLVQRGNLMSGQEVPHNYDSFLESKLSSFSVSHELVEPSRVANMGRRPFSLKPSSAFIPGKLHLDDLSNPDMLVGGEELRALHASSKHLKGSAVTKNKRYRGGLLEVEFGKNVPRMVTVDRQSDTWKTFSVENASPCSYGSLCRPSKGGPHSLKSTVGLFVLPMVGIMFLLAVGISLWWTSHRRYRGRGRAEVILCPETKIFPTRHFRLTANDIRQATGSVSSVFDNITCCRIGEGRSTCVYKVILADGRACAVKILTNQKVYSQSLARRELQTLGNLRHQNIAKLLGYFFDAHTKALVLEFMPNGSLEKHLRNGILNDLHLQQRLEIALDVSQALTYLHHDSVPRIVHGNLTPRNIFLDYDLKARVGDVGLGRLVERLSSPDTALDSPKGSLREPYIAPEVHQQGKFGTRQWDMEAGPRADVYSFGAILLELITGRSLKSSFAEEDASATLSRSSKWQQPRLFFLDDMLVDVTSNVQKRVIAGCIELGLSCMNSVPEDRPNMKDVMAILQEYRQLEEGTS